VHLTPESAIGWGGARPGARKNKAQRDQVSEDAKESKKIRAREGTCLHGKRTGRTKCLSPGADAAGVGARQSPRPPRVVARYRGLANCIDQCGRKGRGGSALLLVDPRNGKDREQFTSHHDMAAGENLKVEPTQWGNRKGLRIGRKNRAREISELVFWVFLLFLSEEKAIFLRIEAVSGRARKAPMGRKQPVQGKAM